MKTATPARSRSEMRNICSEAGSFDERLLLARKFAANDPAFDNFVEITFEDTAHDRTLTASLHTELIELILDTTGAPEITGPNAAEVERVVAYYLEAVMTQGVCAIKPGRSLEMQMGAKGLVLQVTRFAQTIGPQYFFGLKTQDVHAPEVLKQIVAGLSKHESLDAQLRARGVPTLWRSSVSRAVAAGLLSGHSEKQARGFLKEFVT